MSNRRTLSSETEAEPKRCPAIKKNGQPCKAKAGTSGFCIAHDPQAKEWRRKGGLASSRSRRAEKLLPARLRPVVDLLDQALREVHSGALDPRVATAMASLAGALIKAVTTGEIEERVRNLESTVNTNKGRA